MAEPLQRRTDEDGGKFYEHPVRTEEVPDPGNPNGGTIVRPRRYRSVTTALGIIDKEALKFWAANLAARRAMENLPRLINSVRIETCGRARARTEPFGCGTCVDCTQAWVALFHHGETERRAREGSALHDILEWWTKTGQWRYEPRADWGEYAPTPEEMAPYIQQLQQFIDDYALTPESWVVCECTVYNHTFDYAGTLDGIVIVRPVTRKAADFCARIAHAAGLTWAQVLLDGVQVIIDLKSREGEDTELYREMPLQQTAYRFAETMMPKQGLIEAPMLATDGAAILQIRPDGYALRPVVTDGATMKAFRAAVELHAWATELGDYSTQVKAFPRPEGWKPPTWKRAQYPDGSGECACPACDEPGDSRCMFGGVRPLGTHSKEPRKNKVAAGRPTGPRPGVVTVVDNPDGSATFWPPAELLAEQAEAPAPVAKAAPRKRAAPAKRQPGPGSSPTIDSLVKKMNVNGASLRDEDIPF